MSLVAGNTYFFVFEELIKDQNTLTLEFGDKPEDSDNYVMLPKKQYDELCNDAHMLNCLRNNGVDNWEWYGEVVYQYQQERGEED